jgi:hypothetical protein
VAYEEVVGTVDENDAAVFSTAAFQCGGEIFKQGHIVFPRVHGKAALAPRRPSFMLVDSLSE